jgi:hypothetical protein
MFRKKSNMNDPFGAGAGGGLGFPLPSPVSAKIMRSEKTHVFQLAADGLLMCAYETCRLILMYPLAKRSTLLLVAKSATEGGSISKIWSLSTTGEKPGELIPGNQKDKTCRTSTTTIKWFTPGFSPVRITVRRFESLADGQQPIRLCFMGC